MKDSFKIVVPAEFEKSKDGNWKIAGLASTESLDQQGETIIQKGIDLSPIDQKRGYFNWDHNNSPENIIGLVDGYKRGSNGLYVEGRLFKNHTKAKAIREIMESLGEGERGRIGMSVEGQIIERDCKDPRIIKKCRIKNIALTMNPVNTDTYTDIVKSMNSAESIEFDSVEVEKTEPSKEVTFTATQVMEIVQKALGVGAGYTQAPDSRTGGDALAQESMESLKKKKKKKLKKMSKNMYKSNINQILDKLSVLYPDVNKIDLLVAVSERLKTVFPDINESFGKSN